MLFHLTIDGFSSPRVVCRPALPCDTSHVKEFCKFIWDGHDYVQYAWDDWLLDPHGLLAVAEYAGRAVGLAKATLLSPGQWWLEGFRVDPKFQGLKIGTHLHKYMDAWWQQHGDGVLRLMTNSQRVQVHHLCKNSSYSKIKEALGFLASPLTESTKAFQLLQEDDISEALQNIGINFSLGLSGNLVDLGWRFVAPDPFNLQELIKGELAWWWRTREGLLLAWKNEGKFSGDECLLAIGLPACRIEALLDFLLDVRRLAAQLGLEQVFWIAPMRDELATILEMAGFKRDWEHTGYIYEKKHPFNRVD